jgi:predicted MFS family arabinose efflux permease
MTRLLVALAVTQILGWGTTFYIPATLGEAAIAATGLSRPEIFGGVTVMFVVGGIAAPAMGRLVDRIGARPVMMAGSALAALALVVMAFAASLPAWIAAWVLIGLMMPMALANVAFVAVAQAAIARGIPPRRPIALLTLATGLSITLAFPLGTAAATHLGWRDACLSYAAVQLLVCLPLHASVPGGTPSSRAGQAETEAATRVAPEAATRVMLLLAVAFTLYGFCSVALELHLLALLAGAGADAALAVSLAALSGPIRVGARLFDMLLARRVSVLATALGAMALLPPALLCLLAGGPVAAFAFVVLWNVSLGIATVSRAALPLELFGAAGYATRLGRLSLPVSLGQAVGPAVFAALLDRFGAASVAWLGLLFSTGALLALACVAVGVWRRP